MPIEKKEGESKDEFVPRCIGIEISSGKEPSQAAAICYNTWESFSKAEKVKSIGNIRDKKFNEDKWIINFFKNDIKGVLSIEELGLELKDFYNPRYQQSLTANDEAMLNEKGLFGKDDYITIYKYISNEYGTKGYGPNSRLFCKELMIQKDKVFSMEGIVALNDAPGKANRAGGGGYSVFKYRGGNYCKHKWVRYTYDPTTSQLIEPTLIQPAQPSTIPSK